MAEETQPTPNDAAPAAAPQAVLCPYCGRTQVGVDRCVACGGLFEPMSRLATQIAMGPWYVRDKDNPFKPGFSYDTLKSMIQRGRIRPHTVLRGPTTRQFWSIARNTPGVAHLVGFCHRCGAAVNRNLLFCPECSERFVEPRERNELGLAFPTEESAHRAQQELNRRLGQHAEEQAARSASIADPSPAAIDTSDRVAAPAAGEETGLLRASMDEAMQYLAAPQNAEATGYGMTLDSGQEPAADDETPVVARPVDEQSAARASQILGGRTEPAATPVPPMPVPAAVPAPAPPPVTTELPTAAEAPDQLVHPVVRFLPMVVLILLLLVLAGVLTYPLWSNV